MRRFKIIDEEFIVSDSLEIYTKYKQINDFVTKNLKGKLNEYYNKRKYSLDKIVNEVPNYIYQLVAYAIEVHVEQLVEDGIFDVDRNVFINKYFAELIEQNDNLNQIVSDYEQIVRYGKEIKEYRQIEKASRSKWVGGGFGIKGAIKGAATAGVMNMATSAIRSIGDAGTYASDMAKISEAKNKMLQEGRLLEKFNIILDNAIYGVFVGTIRELHRNGLFSGVDIEPDRAKAIFNNTINYEKDQKKIVENLKQCIKLYPYEFAYYDNLLDICGWNDDLIEIGDFFGVQEITDLKRKHEDLLRGYSEVFNNQEDENYNQRDELLALGYSTDKSPTDKDLPSRFYGMSIIYRDGLHGFTKDTNRYLYWLNRSNDLGYGKAQLELGIQYVKGTIVSKDYNKGFQLITRANDKGIENARVELGKCYLYGYGTKVNYEKAFSWLSKSISDYEVDAQRRYYLGIMYEEGLEVQVDLKQAKNNYKKAIPQLKDASEYNDAKKRYDNVVSRMSTIPQYIEEEIKKKVIIGICIAAAILIVICNTVTKRNSNEKAKNVTSNIQSQSTENISEKVEKPKIANRVLGNWKSVADSKVINITNQSIENKNYTIISDDGQELKIQSEGKDYIIYFVNSNDDSIIEIKDEDGNKVTYLKTVEFSNDKNQISSNFGGVSYNLYSNSKYGYSVEYPAYLSTNASTDSDYVEFNNGTNNSANSDYVSMFIEASIINNTNEWTIDKQHQLEMNQLQFCKILEDSYNINKNEYIITAEISSDTMLYEFYKRGQKKSFQFCIKYPKSEVDKYNGIIEHMKKTFKEPNFDN